MMEARVDAVFASIRTDPEFLASPPRPTAAWRCPAH